MDVHEAIIRSNRSKIESGAVHLAWNGKSREGAEQAALIFDKQKIFSRLLGDMDLVKKVLAVFLRETPGILEELERASRAGEYQAAGQLAHRIAGDAGNVSAFALWEAARHLEVSCKQGETAGANLLVKEVLMQFDLLKRVLDWWGILGEN